MKAGYPLQQLEPGVHPRNAWFTAGVMVASIALVSFIPLLRQVFALRHPWIIVFAAVLAASVSTLAWLWLRKGGETWPLMLTLVDTPLYSLVPILIALWSHPFGAGIAIGLHALMALYWGRIAARAWPFFAVVVLPPLLLIPKLLETTWRALEAGLALSLFIVTTVMEASIQRQVEEQRRSETMAAVAEAVRGAHQSAEAAAYAEAGMQVHELRNLLTEPTMCAGLLVEPSAELGDAEREDVQKITDGLADVRNFLIGMIERLSAASAVSSCRLEDVVERMQQRLKRSKSLQPVLRGDFTGPELLGKPNVLADCLVNLVRNAQEAGAQTVTIDLFEEVESVTLRVADNGPGIPPQIVDRLFQPGVTHGKAGGTGYALHIMKVTLETIGGSIELVSPQPVQGALFDLRLPLRGNRRRLESEENERSSDDISDNSG